MKTMVTFLVFAASAIVSVIAQDAKSGKANLQVQTGKKGAEQMVAPGSKPTARKGEPIFKYGGFLADWTTRNKRASSLDLRGPPRPKPAVDNVYTDPQSGAVKGFVLFAIKF